MHLTNHKVGSGRVVEHQPDLIAGRQMKRDQDAAGSSILGHPNLDHVIRKLVVVVVVVVVVGGDAGGVLRTTRYEQLEFTHVIALHARRPARARHGAMARVRLLRICM